MTERQEQYAEYRKSQAWRDRRERALRRADHKCQVCNSSERLDVHHRTYARIFKELDQDLTVLCRACHDRHHGKSTPAAKKNRKATAMQARILAVLELHPGSTTDEVAAYLEAKSTKVGGTLGGLRTAGRVSRIRRLWYLPR